MSVKVFLNNQNEFNALIARFGGREEVAFKCNISMSTLHNLINNKGVKAKTAHIVAKALNKKFDDIFLV